ncbi:Choline-sulfatase [Planctomycetes bacterium CA13]|uniref:Choline-sulfatase n=1 Tax=Novipirellula herctigrandis TaxID=2527986 RepID=A0A5C5ZB10_9BACT|nr:Choline-sulfatase [Planctomycetes bacterium CA13]
MQRILICALLCQVTGVTAASAVDNQTAPAVHSNERPNVLVIIADDLMKQVGVYGYDFVETPNLNRLTKESMLFDRAYCQYPLCGPSCASLFLSTYPSNSEITCNQGGKSSNVQKKAERLGIKTMPAHFREHGYVTVGGGKLYHDTVLPETESAKLDFSVVLPSKGKDGVNVKDPKTKDKRTRITSASEFGVYEHKDGALVKNAKQWLQQRAKKSASKPFFMCVGLKKPHSPYAAPKRFFNLHQREAMQITDIKPPGDILTHYSLSFPNALLSVHADKQQYDAYSLPAAKKKEMMQGYAACVSYADFLVGDLLDSLKQTGFDDNTIVVFTSDHGYKLGEYDRWAKFTLHEKDAVVPLIVRVPGLQSGHNAKSDAIVGLIDLYPTLATLCDVPVPPGIDGISFASTLRDKQSSAREYIHTFVTRAERTTSDNVTHPKAIGASATHRNGYRYTQWWQGEPATFPSRSPILGVELYDHYHKSNSPISQRNISAVAPDRVKEMQENCRLVTD